MSKKPLMAVFGGGNIGRGFIGQLFVQSGYDVVFIDANQKLVEELNKAQYYPLQLVSNEHDETMEIGPVSACLISDSKRVNIIISNADIMATAVGVPILPHIAKPLAAGLAARRAAGNNQELDILVCENMLGAGEHLRALIGEADPELKLMLNNKIGFVETSIGRMVPVLSDLEKKGNPLLIRSEFYDELPVDAAGFRAAIPQIFNLKPFTPFHFYHERKLFIHNMGHAATAYLGALIGVDTIADAILRPTLRLLVEDIMRQVGSCLSAYYHVDKQLLEDHIQDLLNRFANQKLGDTITRVGRDPLRKLAADDRLAGALRFVVNKGEAPYHLATAMAAAMHFDNQDDPTSDQMHKMIEELGIDCFLQDHCGLSASEYDNWRAIIIAQYQLIDAVFSPDSNRIS